MAAAVVYVKNAKPNITTLGLPPEGKVARSVKLMPGVNEVPTAEWDLVKGLAVTRAMIEAESLVEVGEGTLGELRAPAAKKMIDSTFDRALLNKWKAAETRPAVLGAIEAQLAKVDPEKDPRIEDARKPREGARR